MGKIRAVFIVAAALLLALLALSSGIIDISLRQLLAILAALFTGGEESILSDVIYYLRLPRFVMGLTVGGALAVCGTVMQAVMKNPLADPYLLGISSGAGLGAVLAIILGFSDFAGYDCVGVFAFGGALAVTLAILAISLYCGRANNLAVLLSGLALNAVCSAAISFLVAVFADAEKLQSVTFWLMGSLLKNDWESILAMAAAVAVVSLFLLTRFRILNLMLLGDDVSVTLGHDLSNSRRLYILLCAVMIGSVVYNAGMIGFVGLIVPHIARLLVGNNHLKLLPLSMLLGAVFLTLADTVGRLAVIGSEVPIGVIASLFGSPVFVYLLVNRKHGYGK